MTESPLLNPEQHRRPQVRKGLRLLLIDPHPESRALLKAAVRSIDSVDTVRETSNTYSLPQILSEAKFDVILIEQHIENVDVFDVVKDLKREPATAHMKFVLMSSQLDTESRRRGIEAGILGYLAKPFDINSLERALKDAMGKVSTNHKDILNKVRRIEFFSDFADMELVRLLKICHTRKFNAGENVFSEGEIGDRLYVLIAGRVEIIKNRIDGGSELLVTLQPGDVFGEMALVDQEPRSADARAGTDCMIIEVNSEIMNDVNDILALKLFRKVAILVTKRLRSYTAQHVNRPD